MKLTVNWLKDYLETDASTDRIADALTGVGLEVESVENAAEALAPFTVAKVIEARQHPDADRLRVCDVETANGKVQVVCGAPNARTGMTGIFAAPGTKIPGTGVDLKVGVIRGVESAGMLCSERELMISDEHDGIIDLDCDFAIGTPAAVALGLDDPVIDIGVTPNRPDGLGVYGIARDLAAAGIGKLKPLDAMPVQGTFKSPVTVSLQFDGGTDPCPLFVGRYFRGVTNRPSPDWLQRRLRAIGLRPISALVDITNYVTHAFGRPLHVFDAAKVKGNICARLARDGETIEALDGKTYTLDDAMTVIADEAGPEAIGGIMGGEPSGCTETTTDVFLEAAWFDPIRTATSGRKLGINSDARFRFERGVDPEFVQTGAEIGSALILELCGGEASELVIAGEAPDHSRSFPLRKSRVAGLAGIEVPADDQARILAALGFGVSDNGDRFECSVPPWRPDVHGEADLVEEICRITGLDKIESAPLPRIHAVAQPVLTVLQKRMVAARRALAGRGLNEAVTWSFQPGELAGLFGGGAEDMKLANPISAELSDMRPSLIGNLVTAAGRNVSRGFADVGLFEVGQTYAGLTPADESLKAAGLRRGRTGPRHWNEAPRAVDAYDAKADALAVLAAAGAPVASLQVVQGAPSWFHPGRSGTIQLGPKNQLGWFGEVHPAVLEKLDVKGPAVAFEVVLDAIPKPRGTAAARAALAASDLMPLTRDFAFVVDDTVTADQVMRAAKGADKVLIAGCSVFDVFTGGNLGDGRKSIAIEVTLQPAEKTLTDEEIEKVSEAIVGKVTRATGGELRR